MKLKMDIITEELLLQISGGSDPKNDVPPPPSPNSSFSINGPGYVNGSVQADITYNIPVSPNDTVRVTAITDTTNGITGGGVGWVHRF